MTMKYVRDTYGVPVRRGSLVRQIDGLWRGKLLVVTRCTHYVHARPQETRRRAFIFHPLNLEYKTVTGWYRPRPSHD